MRLVGLIYLINKTVVALVESRRAVEMLSGSELGKLGKLGSST